MDENSSMNLEIDVKRVISDRLGAKARFIPGFAVGMLERLICQDHLNRILRNNAHRSGAEFCHGALTDMGVSFKVEGLENMPSPEDTRVLYVSNHPLGGLDGLILIDFLSGYHGREVRFVVNDLLSAVKPMASLFVPVNKHGAQGKEAVRKVNQTFGGDDPIVMFPAGLCSRRNSDGEIRDLDWQKMFVIKAKQSGRTVIPLYFSGHNSSFFYKFARWREKVGIRFNIEMILLPREMVRGEGKTYTIHVGKPVEPFVMEDDSPLSVAREIRRRVYLLSPDTTR
ncbi:MAG: 1-acyl-sn-glycerol-3-phosphate acyltransferase [Muribaculaceae bacterium]|nr:1-acyl-sn-glycerol-3-phosphate acyltransferase [Muribaculaceae bacterium]